MAIGTWMSPERLVGATPPVAVVEQTEYVLTPVQQVEEIPTDVYELLMVLSSQPLPDQWFDAGCVVPVAETASAPSSILTINVLATVIAVVFWDSTGQTTRYGYGIQSKVTIDLGNGGPLIHSGAFKLVRETADSSEAMVGAVEFTNSLEQNALGIGAVGIVATAGVYTDCVGLCITGCHEKAWALVKKCMVVVEDVAFAAAGACALACLLSTGGWLACVTLCMTAPVGGLAMFSGTCIAAYIALLTVSIPLCTLGCIGV